MSSDPIPEREKRECLWFASVSAATHKDSADKSTAWFRWDGGQLTLYTLSWTVSAVIKAKLVVKNQKKNIEWPSRKLFFFYCWQPCPLLSFSSTTTSPNCCPELKRNTKDVSLTYQSPFYCRLNTLNKPSGKTWMFQIFTTAYRLCHHLWLTTWCHLFQHQSARRNLCR